LSTLECANGAAGPKSFEVAPVARRLGRCQHNGKLKQRLNVRRPWGASSSGGTIFLQARTANEALKAQSNKVRLARLKGELVDRAQASGRVFVIARAERDDAWLNWPSRISAQMAAKLGGDGHTLHAPLESAVREHLQALGERRVRVD
jgi:hypothetical protein